MAESTALGHMGLMFGLLAVVLMVYATALSLPGAAPGTANTGFVWAFLAWGVGLVFVIVERFRPIRGP